MRAYKFLILAFLSTWIPLTLSTEIGSDRRYCPEEAHIQPTIRTLTGNRLAELRKHMRRETSVGSAKPLDAYIITSNDEHQSETVSDHDKRREYITGFTGSRGVAVVTLNKAALWVDGRYHIQADNEISCDWLLMRSGKEGVPEIAKWIKAQLPPNSRIGSDPKLAPNDYWELLKFDLESNSTLSLVGIRKNLIDLIWDKTLRPPKSTAKIYVWDIQYAGVPWQEKVVAVRKEMKENDADVYLVSALDEIAWLLNIRGNDIPHSPVVESYVILTLEEVHFYVNPVKLTTEVRQHFKADFCASTECVKIHQYEDIWAHLRTYSQIWNKVILDGASQAIFQTLPGKRLLLKESIINNMKSIKNPTEIKGMENAHIRDGAIMCDFLAHFEQQFNNGEPYDELKLAKELDSFRYELYDNNLFKGTSFPTIVGFSYHGASPHYEPKNSSSIPITTDSTIVIDSGGQYLDGTTDVTRTLHMGEPTQEQKEMYTRVLMGQIQLSSLIFPANMIMGNADILARSPLWNVGLDYMHGTGHGIGSFLNVHEAPINLFYGNKKLKFKEGYFLSNEPGFYKEGEFGIRLENIMETIADKTKKNHQSGEPFLKFVDVTLVPYDTKLIDEALLTVPYRRWLNTYNERIRKLVGAELKKEFRMKGFYWMMKHTKYIPEYGHISGAESISHNYLLYSAIFVISILIL
ncbi:xaa-Pro aminopeptidase ApepP-like [Chrysoperla carnea]|uniref:xaa-Pro aminopeptidase ApepP-like n=1 Tax=Chrysoperla carnea TaxID=189513 RepID=UPI001D05DFD7|nr:xaa-Pro aminopeptidase ApepP-like [Chrysoperla carnea]